MMLNLLFVVQYTSMIDHLLMAIEEINHCYYISMNLFVNIHYTDCNSFDS